jgi:hypothetical protein
LELSGREVFVPQSYELGQEAQVDWFEGVAKLGGEARKLEFFAMRSMGSGDAFHRAYPHATQQALLEAHEHAFAYFAGVFKTLRYDNMIGPGHVTLLFAVSIGAARVALLRHFVPHLPKREPPTSNRQTRANRSDEPSFEGYAVHLSSMPSQPRVLLWRQLQVDSSPPLFDSTLKHPPAL